MNITNRETAIAELLRRLKTEADSMDVDTEGSVYDLVLALSDVFDEIDWVELLIDVDADLSDAFDFIIDDVTYDFPNEEDVFMRLARYGNGERAEFDEALNALADAFVSKVKEARR